MATPQRWRTALLGRDAARSGRRRDRPCRRAAVVGRPDRPAGRARPGREPTKDTVFLVTGAAGSIVSADHRRPGGGIGRARSICSTWCRRPTAAIPTWQRFATDPDGLKRDLADRIRERGERPTPKLVERELAGSSGPARRWMRSRRSSAAGGTAHWHQVDLTDPEQVSPPIAAALNDERADRRAAALRRTGHQPFLPDKPQREYDLVFDVKAHGWLNILAALETAATARRAAAIVFSSIAGRFGNARPDRLLGRERPAVQEHLEHAAGRPHPRHRDRLDRMGERSAWRAAARSRR